MSELSASRKGIQKQVFGLIKRQGEGKVLVVSPELIDLTGDHVSALLFSQILYWSERTTDPEGWFYKSDEEWRKELRITPYQRNRAIKNLCALEIGIEAKLKRSGRAPLLHFRVADPELLLNRIMKFLDNQNNPITKKVDNPYSEYEETSETEPISRSGDDEETSKSEAGLSRNLVGDYKETSKTLITEITSEKRASETNASTNAESETKPEGSDALFSKGELIGEDLLWYDVMRHICKVKKEFVEEAWHVSALTAIRLLKAKGATLPLMDEYSKWLRAEWRGKTLWPGNVQYQFEEFKLRYDEEKAAREEEERWYQGLLRNNAKLDAERAQSLRDAEAMRPYHEAKRKEREAEEARQEQERAERQREHLRLYEVPEEKIIPLFDNPDAPIPQATWERIIKGAAGARLNGLPYDPADALKEPESPMRPHVFRDPIPEEELPEFLRQTQPAVSYAKEAEMEAAA